MEGFINIDNRPEPEPDLLCDVVSGLPFDDSSVDMIRAFDFMEHIPNAKVLSVVEDIYRVLKMGGIFEHFTPSSDGRGLWQDFNHQSHWNINSNLYWTVEDYRRLYDTKAFFHPEEIRDVVSNDALHVVHTYARLRKIEFAKSDTHALLQAVKP